MFFNDDFKQRKVNMGSYSLTSKDDFLKKMEEEEKKEKNKKKLMELLKLLKIFLIKIFIYHKKLSKNQS